MNQIILFKIIFEFYAYVCITLFFVGSIYKITKAIINVPAYSNTEKNISQSINIGVITLIFLHFAGYFIARELFMLIGLSEGLQSRLSSMFAGIITTFFLTYLVIVICKKYFKQHMSFKGSWAEKGMSLIIILHIFLGFLAIGATTSLEEKAVKSIGFSNYFSGLFSFAQNPSQYLVELKWITLSHLILGYSLIATLPFTKVIDLLVGRIKRLILNLLKILKINKTTKNIEKSENI